jgi:hypothetical protein
VGFVKAIAAQLVPQGALPSTKLDSLQQDAIQSDDTVKK